MDVNNPKYGISMYFIGNWIHPHVLLKNHQFFCVTQRKRALCENPVRNTARWPKLRDPRVPEKAKKRVTGVTELRRGFPFGELGSITQIGI